LIINVVRLTPGTTIDHLSLPKAKQMIEEIKPNGYIHFGIMMWQARPWELAKRLTEEAGISVITARDGGRFDLSQLQK